MRNGKTTHNTFLARGPNVDFKGKNRTNKTHQSKTDPDSKIYTKSSEVAAKLSYTGHATMENPNGLTVHDYLKPPGSASEHESAIEKMHGIYSSHQTTVAGDNHDNQKPFLEAMKKMHATSHVAHNNITGNSIECLGLVSFIY